jgi:tetratricopeptide (TPR) repeat protein
MDKRKQAAKVEQLSADSRDAVSRRRINIQMVQNVLLIGPDNNIDNNSTDCLNSIAQLSRIVNSINMFTDIDQCVDCVTDIDSKKICMIISGEICQNIMPLIHDIAQLHTIFIFCESKTADEPWAKEWFKVKGVFVDISSICEALKLTAQQYEQNAISTSCMTTSNAVSKENLDQLNPSFIYTQILKETLLTIPFEKEHLKQFTDYCRDVFVENPGQLKNVDKLQGNYHEKTPIWWYTYDCFLYSMLNLALRLMNVDIMIKIGFFISDLHRHIEQLHSEQFGGQNSSNSFQVYRGQGMAKTEFEEMKKNKDGVLSFNSFLSTSKNYHVSRFFAESNQCNPDLVGILFIIKVDPSLPSASFALINNIGHFPEEDEVLFTMNTVFRIHEITTMDENHCLFQVKLTLSNDNDFRALTDHIREETFPNSRGWYRLGNVLLKMGHFEKAQQVYEILLEQAIEDSEKAPIYHQLGLTKYAQGGYQEAITFFEKALEIYEKTLPPNDSELASSFNNIGLVYKDMGEYSKALSSHVKALEIKQKSLPPNHFDLSSSYCHIGKVYHSMGEYSKALSSHEKSLEIKRQSLPPNHPELAKSYIAHGLVYNEMGEYSKAIMFYEKALEIQQESLPPNHPSLGASYNSIGSVYNSIGEYSKALLFYEKYLDISQKSLPPNHPDLAASYNNIGEVHLHMHDYTKALFFFEKTLEIQQTTLPPNHPDFTYPYKNMGNVYDNMGEYSKAYLFYERAVEIGQHSLPSNHAILQKCRKHLENVKKKL